MDNTLRVPPGHLQWVIERSHLSNHPQFVEAVGLRELRRQVQELADSKPAREGVPAIGKISFRYEADADHQIVVIHTYFINKHGVPARFMRLRRKDRLHAKAA